MSAVRYTLRPATFADVAPVAALLREAKFKARSEAGWRWLFHDNPAHRRQDPPPPMGWVLDRDGALDGYLGNVHLDYVLDGKPVRAATCTSYYVRPEARSESTRLMSAFFRQPGVELYLSTTANAQSDPIYRLYKAAVPEDASFAHGLVWIADDSAVLRDGLAALGVPRALARGTAAVVAPISRLTRALVGFAHAPRRDAESVVRLRPAEIDGRFDALWERVASAPGLRVRRDSESLRWYLSDPDAGGEPAIFALSDGQGIAGYAAAARHRPPGASALQLRLLDVLVRPGAERAIPALLAAVVRHAREIGAGLVYSAPCGAALAAEFKRLRPYAHRHDYAAHFLRAAARGDTAQLTRAGVWQASALDGDTPFCIEHEAAAHSSSPRQAGTQAENLDSR
jgi:hypothetical protein